MFDGLSKLAQAQATRLSRRAFFGEIARTALPVAAALGGLLMFSRDAEAFHRHNCCCAPDGSVCMVPLKQPCPPGTALCSCKGRFAGAPRCR